MIIDKFVKLNLNSRNIKRLKDYGYFGKIGDSIDVLTEHLSSGCQSPVNIICDICKCERIMPYGEYYNNIKNGGFYSCNKCKTIKYRKTCLEKYGVEYAFQNEDVKNKIKNTNLEKYGCENVFQNEDIKEKSKQTCLKKYGVEFYFESKERTEKIKKTKLDRYNDENYNNIEKTKETCLEKYKVDSYMKTEDFMKISKDYNFKYRKEIIKKTKSTNLDIYGCENVFQNQNIKDKIKETCLKKYGFEYPSQNEEFFIKCQKQRFKKYQYGNSELYYQGSYEKDFLDIYYNKIKITKANPFEYYLNNKIHIYFPDFYLPDYNTIIEIKSSYTYNKEYEINMIKKDTCLKNNFNFLFIIDKEYTEIEKLL